VDLARLATIRSVALLMIDPAFRSTGARFFAIHFDTPMVVSTHGYIPPTLADKAMGLKATRVMSEMGIFPTTAPPFDRQSALDRKFAHAVV
jgi:hypothetical protein